MNTKLFLNFKSVLTATLCLLCLDLPSAFAAVKTWVASPSDGNFATGANWGGTAPVSGDSLVFDTSNITTLSDNLAIGLNVAGITFNSTASAYSISGSNFTLTSGITSNAALVERISNLINMTGARTVTTVAGGEVVLSGNISGSGGSFTGAGLGLLTLSGNNTFTGGVNLVSAGTAIKGMSNMAFGTGTISLSNGSQYSTALFATDSSDNFANNIAGAITTTGAFNLVSDRATAGAGVTHALGAIGATTAGTMTSSSGMALFQSGSNVTSGTSALSFLSSNIGATTNGAVVLNPIGTSATFAALTPTLESSTTANTTLNLILAGSGTGLAGSANGSGAVTGAISDSINNGSSFHHIAQITKAGPSTWTFSGADTYTGSTTLNGGKLILDYSTQDNSKLADAAILTLSGGTLALSGGTHTELVLNTTLSGGGNFITRPSGAASIALGNITFSGGGVDIQSSGMATTNTTNDASGILNGRATFGGTDYAANNGSGAIVAYSGYTALNATSTSNLNTTNYNLAGSQTQSTGSTNVKTLKLTTTGAGQALTLATGAALTTASGGSILFSGANDYSILTAGSGKINSAGGNLILHNFGTGNLTLGAIGSTLEQYGTGKTILSVAASANSGLTINGGTIQFSNNLQIGTDTGVVILTLNNGTLLANTSGGSIALDNAGTFSRNISVGLGGGTIDVIGGNTLTISGVISSSGIPPGQFSAPLTLGSSVSSGTINLTGNNTFTGGAILAGGTVALGVAENATVSGPLGKYGVATGSAQANYITFAGGTLQHSSVNTFDYSSRFAQVANQQFNIDTNGQTVTYATGLSGASSTLTKLGSGVLTLSGTSNYTGATTISAGTLQVNGSTSSSSAVAINTGGTLGGVGAVNGSVTLNNGGFITPGNVSASGTITLGSLTWNSGGVITFGLGTSQDSISILGALTKGTGSTFAFNIFDAGGTTTSTYNLLNFGSTSFASTDFSSTGLTGTFGITGSTLQFTVAAVPEPSTYAMLIGGLLLMTMVVRRRKLV